MVGIWPSLEDVERLRGLHPDALLALLEDRERGADEKMAATVLLTVAWHDQIQAGRTTIQEILQLVDAPGRSEDARTYLLIALGQYQGAGDPEAQRVIQQRYRDELALRSAHMVAGGTFHAEWLNRLVELMPVADTNGQMIRFVLTILPVVTSGRVYVDSLKSRAATIKDPAGSRVAVRTALEKMRRNPLALRSLFVSELLDDGAWLLAQQPQVIDAAVRQLAIILERADKEAWEEDALRSYYRAVMRQARTLAGQAISGALLIPPPFKPAQQASRRGQGVYTRALSFAS
ncbi:MAG TPA: hypothetical protein VJB16_02505, partial [archaeon]|nr:hypothetical protein [archaeon]